MYNFKEIKEFLKKYEEQGYQIYDSRNTVGDSMETVYNKDGVTIDECSYYGYVEIFGITKDEYDSLWEGPYKLKIK